MGTEWLTLSCLAEGRGAAAIATRARDDENVSMSVALLADVNQQSNFKFSGRKPPLTLIRRSKSVGTDLKSLRDVHSVYCEEGIQHNIGNHGKYAHLHVTAPPSCAQLPVIIKQDHWVTMDIAAAPDPPGAGASTSGENAKSLEADGLNSPNSEKWSFSNFIGVVFPLRRTSSELVLPTQIMPV